MRGGSARSCFLQAVRMAGDINYARGGVRTRRQFSNPPQRTRALVVRAQQRLAVGVDLAHVGQGSKEGLSHLVSLQRTDRTDPDTECTGGLDRVVSASNARPPVASLGYNMIACGAHAQSSPSDCFPRHLVTPAAPSPRRG